MTQQEEREFYGLLGRVCDGDASNQDFNILNKWLESSAVARRLYRDFCGMHMDVEELGRTNKLAKNSQPAKVNHPIRWIAPIISAAAAAVVFCVQLFMDSYDTLPFAKILDSESVVWSGTQYDASENLVDETFAIRSGVARLGLDNGVVVTLEGPAEIEFSSNMNAMLHYGRLAAYVPPSGQGFTVVTPEVDVVDQGTEFGLEVGAGGKTEVHVFDGWVDVVDKEHEEGKPLPITAGLAIAADTKESIDLRHTSFERTRNALTGGAIGDNFPSDNFPGKPENGWTTPWGHELIGKDLKLSILDQQPLSPETGSYLSAKMIGESRRKVAMFLHRGYGNTGDLDTNLPHTVEILFRLNCPVERVQEIHFFEATEASRAPDPGPSWKIRAFPRPDGELAWHCFNSFLPDNAERHQILPLKQDVTYRLLIDVDSLAGTYRTTISDGKKTIWNSRFTGDPSKLGGTGEIGGMLNLAVRGYPDRGEVDFSIDAIRIRNRPTVASK